MNIPRRRFSADDSIGFKHRNALKLLTMVNAKTPKGEGAGWLTAILYLHPHDSGGGKTLCPHSTPACRAMCLAGAGLGALPKAQGAKSFRTDLFLNHQKAFLRLLRADIGKLKAIAGQEGMRAAVRLNGTSDILWERLLDMSDRAVRFYDYTKVPIEHRGADGYRLTYSVGGAEDIPRAQGYLAAGQSVAVVVPEEAKATLLGQTVRLPSRATATFIDGDDSDLRFLDPPASIVLLKPKGHIRTDLIRPNIRAELEGSARTHSQLRRDQMPRLIEPMNFPNLSPERPVMASPIFEWVDPRGLLVDDQYQRHISRKGVDLIEKIVREWDWARYKPPVVAKTPHGLEVIDGQHTATAAASHPYIDSIPVMIVPGIDVAARADAFVGHNRDRLGLSQVQIHYANVAAGDEEALTLQQVCERAGVTLLRYPPGNGEFKPGDTLAIASIKTVLNRRYAAGARQVLQVLADANCAPVRAEGIKAVEMLLFDHEYKGQISGPDITSAVLALGPQAERDARVFAAAHQVPIWRALAIVLFKKGGRRGLRRTG